MSRTVLKLASLFLGAGCLVVFVRAQDSASSPVQPLEAGRGLVSDGEPTPAIPRADDYRSPVESNPSASALQRPSAAERLQQVRDVTSRSGSTKAAARGTTVIGPVTSDPTGLRAPRIAEQPGSPGLISPTTPAKSAISSDSDSTGGSSVLKKSGSDSNLSNDRATARRPLRSSNKQSATIIPKTNTTPLQQAVPTAATPKIPKTEGVLQSRGTTLRVETIGPKTLKLGSESTYTIHVHNEGDVEAHDIFVRAGLPRTAKVIAEGSSAEAGQATDSPNEQRFVWTIGHLAARGTETLTLRVTPTDPESIDLFVDWTMRPISALAQIEVQQPQLEMSVFGPKDIAYGEAAKYTIRLSNPGNGDADGVTVEFRYGQEKLEAKSVGILAAGQQQEISLELTARQSGALPVVAIASASGGLRAEASQEVLVRRAALETEVTGDAAIFAGSPAGYRVVIRNAGNAPANQVSANIVLPEGAQVIAGADEAQPTQNGLLWNVGVLPPNGERTLDIQAQLNVAGENAFNVRVSGAGELESNGSFVTRVEALADLKLTVNDPQGPVAVGQDCIYEVHIANRGTKTATKINVVAQFSPGIEPVEATGSPAELVPGQVLFQPVPRIDPGQEVVLIVRAKADSQGPKRFRAEVSCEELDTQLVAQETTYFFADSSNKTSKAKSSTGKR